MAVPTVTRNAAVLFAKMLGEVPKPLAIVGAVEEIMRWPPLSANDVELVVPVTARPVEENVDTIVLDPAAICTSATPRTTIESVVAPAPPRPNPIYPLSVIPFWKVA